MKVLWLTVLETRIINGHDIDVVLNQIQTELEYLETLIK